MKSNHKVLAYELLEQKRLLAADVCEHEPMDASLAVESAPMVIEENDTLRCSFGEPAVVQSSLETDEVRALNGEDEQSGEAQETEDKKDDDGDSDGDSDDDSDDDDSDDDDSDNDDSNDDDSDDDDSNDDDSNDDDSNDDDSDDDDSDDDETIPTSSLTATGTESAAASSFQASNASFEYFLVASSESESTRSASRSVISLRNETAPAQTTANDAAIADLLLSTLGFEKDDESESTEFVGRSDQRDLAPAAFDVAHELTSELIVEHADRRGRT